MKNRRKFIKSIGATLASTALLPLGISAFENESNKFDTELIDELLGIDVTNDTDFWAWVQQSYTSSTGFINLNNGGVSPQPRQVQEAFKRYNDLSNEAPSYYMWRTLKKDLDGVKEKLASLAGVSPDEIAINRNTTEALDTIINGLSLNKGDEIVLSKYDYPNMKSVWKMREKRDGIVLKWIDFPVPCEDEDLLVKRFTDQFTSKTKIVHITHLINWTGQILPARKIADAAHNREIEVLVDGAHSFAHIDYTIPDLGCDYYGTSLHKWLCAPFGTGLLYVKKDKIAKLWPSFPNDEPGGDVISKFENLGTRSVPAEVAIGQAINFHLAIGAKRKQERLHELKNYWISKVEKLPGIRIYTSKDPKFSGALATAGIEGIEGDELAGRLQREYQIHVTNIQVEQVNGVRITPHVYTRFEDLDRLVTAFEEMTQK
ncbi:MAG: aminotransferase class V-fold PLP-dependent enzyme [Flavobacteriales bacterium]|nr:aminotransferase class V-fold PLP-dependent enzyme [Flavobacteriales bacterium]